jgi:cell wall-associated NlpC family hydrolase
VTGPVVRGAQLAPGDLLIVDGTAGASKLIEIGAVLDGDPAASHVAIYHHTDAHGTAWAVEGRPGGVGWRDAHDYDTDPRTLTNAAQPKTPAQRTEICMYAVKLLGTGYDWIGGIAEDAALALHLPQLWTPDPASGQVPAHVVCSSLAAWVYDRAGLDAPGRGDWEHVTPGAWALFIGQRGWEHTA